MNIIVLAEDYPPNQGGIAEYAFNLCASLRKKHHNIQLVTAHVSGDSELDRTSGYSITRIGECDVRKKPLGLLARIRAVTRFRKELHAWIGENLEEKRPDFALVTSVSVWAHELERYGIPYAVCVHGGDAFGARTDWLRSLYRRTVVRRVFANASLIFTNSEYTARMVSTDATLEAKTLATYCGVAPEFLDEIEKMDVCGQLQLDQKGSHVLVICRLVPIKAVDVVIRAVAMLTARHPEIRLTIAGDGPERQKLEALAQSLGVAGHICFPGYIHNVEEKAGLFAKADVLAHSGRVDLQTGRAEAFGIAFAEAGACCRPAVGPRMGGVGEVIQENVTGLLVEPDDVDSMAAALDAVLSNPERARKMGVNGRERVLSHFTYGLIAEKLTLQMQEVTRRS